MPFSDAEDTMRLIASFVRCPAKVKESAAAMRSEIQSLSEAEHKRIMRAANENAAEDVRIQRNALKMMDPKQAKNLTRQEREEVFRRSLKAMGLTEDGPMTPGQKDLVQRMYRTMVLGEPAVADWAASRKNSLLVVISVVQPRLLEKVWEYLRLFTTLQQVSALTLSRPAPNYVHNSAQLRMAIFFVNMNCIWIGLALWRGTS